jgi:ribonuclease HI
MTLLTDDLRRRAMDNCLISGHEWVIEHAVREANSRPDVCASQLYNLHQLPMK